MNRRLTVVGGIVGGAGVGAALMYFLDPDRGRRRRAGVRDKAATSLKGITCALGSLGAASRDARNRAYGLYAEAQRRLRRDDVDDATLEARVRSRLGHKISNPRWVDVQADHGRVSLGGRVSAADAAALLSCVSGVPGVKEVANQVEIQ